MTEKWVEIRKGGNYKDLGLLWGVSPVVARIMKNRGINTAEEARDYLKGGPESFNDGSLMADCHKCVQILKDKIREGKTIRVIGDYDIDGVCASYILTDGLKAAGALVDYVIPHRVKDGYGLNENLIREAAEDGIDTILTCDNGISAGPQVEDAHRRGMTVLVTDHHEIAALPPAEAVVDPHRSDCAYPFKMLCGAAVAWKVLQQLYRIMGVPLENAEKYLEIAAFATIGDVMPLIGENRILVREGLKRLSHTQNLGMQALMDLNGLSQKEITPYHVGFVLGPCLNAAGRLDTAEYAMRLLFSKNADEAHSAAVVLKEMNDSRKTLTDQGVEAACKLAEDEPYVNQKVLVLPILGCHESIAGIVAGKVRERYCKPVFILTEGSLPDGTPCYKGSGRSIEAYNMFQAMNRVSELFQKFGGHAMAAGLSILPEQLPELERRLNEECGLTEEDLAEKVRIDMALPFSYVNMDLVEELNCLAPFGMANEKPLFATRKVEFRDIRIFGERRNVLKALVADESGSCRDAVYFGDAEGMRDYIEGKGLVSVTYYPDKNEFRQQVSLQVVIKNVM
ncbi:MAG: single-stranded-DNA-specific exonuclease RecJ [Lachnospiraceae bacterium]|nr:single-stranded-DNA-specific exonuclease RecJ [Lachnospiraceae bacterium]